jgi:hypothetical protein
MCPGHLDCNLGVLRVALTLKSMAWYGSYATAYKVFGVGVMKHSKRHVKTE